MFYSSGTTGHPKGIAREAVRVPVGTPGTFDGLMREGFGFGADMVYLCPGPLYHAAPLAWSMATQRAGGTAVVMERFDALETLELIERHRVTHVQFVPTMMRRLLRLPEADRRRCDLSSLRVVVHAAAPCPPEVKRGMIDWLGPIVHEFYAGSEGNGFFTIGSEEWLAHPGSVGRASYGTAHVLDDDGNELPPGEVGTIWFEGTARFRYHNDPGKTAGAFNDRGWSTLGDVGHLDADGYLYLSDRRVDLILSGGVNIYPQEIEDTLCRNKNVVDAAVIGAPDEEMGQRVLAVVQPDPAAHADRALADELFAHCREHLAGFKCPREITFSHELPRLPTGSSCGAGSVRTSQDARPVSSSAGSDGQPAALRRLCSPCSRGGSSNPQISRSRPARPPRRAARRACRRHGGTPAASGDATATGRRDGTPVVISTLTTGHPGDLLKTTFSSGRPGDEALWGQRLSLARFTRATASTNRPAARRSAHRAPCAVRSPRTCCGRTDSTDRSCSPAPGVTFAPAPTALRWSSAARRTPHRSTSPVAGSCRS